MIPRIANILYTTDLSKNSAYAFRYAINSAQRHDARIHIFYVIETAAPASEKILQWVIPEEKLEKVRGETKESMVKRIGDRLMEFAGRELKDDPETMKRVASVRVVFGDPAVEILREADDPKYDIVIMGTHGKGIIGHTFLGSVSEKVLHRISKPVLIVPLPKGETDITLEEI
jgi:nucleotide-binding universal stress UspA family protein